MKSFLSLFDPNENSENVLSENDDFSHCQQLPPEPQVGNIEYKLKLINPSKLRFQHLVTQVSLTIFCELINLKTCFFLNYYFCM